jgi:hypothetical protein
VTYWAEVFLGVIAVATLASALVHVATLVGVAVVTRRIMQLVEDIERRLEPAFAHLDAIGKDASRASALAVAQAERVDRLLAGAAARVDDAIGSVQGGLRVPGREVRALLTGLRAALVSLREMRAEGRRRGPGGEDENALFI